MPRNTVKKKLKHHHAKTASIHPQPHTARRQVTSLQYKFTSIAVPKTENPASAYSQILPMHINTRTRQPESFPVLPRNVHRENITPNNHPTMPSPSYHHLLSFTYTTTIFQTQRKRYGRKNSWYLISAYPFSCWGLRFRGSGAERGSAKTLRSRRRDSYLPDTLRIHAHV